MRVELCAQCEQSCERRGSSSIRERVSVLEQRPHVVLVAAAELQPTREFEGEASDEVCRGGARRARRIGVACELPREFGPSRERRPCAGHVAGPGLVYAERQE